MNEKCFEEIIKTFENDDIKDFFVNGCIPRIPSYFYSAPASSSGRYHSKFALGDGGLARHTLALCRIMNHLFSIESVGTMFTSRERDLMRIAGMMHDSRKSGSQEDYENSKWTRFDHPLLAANVVREVEGLSEAERELIATAIESHMGQWCTDSRSPEVKLPKPENKYQILVHACDYLASRKDIEILFDNEDIRHHEETPDVNTWKLPFGKHKGETLIDVNASDPGYIQWAKENANSEPFRTLVNQL